MQIGLRVKECLWGVVDFVTCCSAVLYSIICWCMFCIGSCEDSGRFVSEVVKTLEEKRKTRDKKYYEQKKKANVRVLVVACSNMSCLVFYAEIEREGCQEAQPKLAEINKQLAEMGYAQLVLFELRFCFLFIFFFQC